MSKLRQFRGSFVSVAFAAALAAAPLSRADDDDPAKTKKRDLSSMSLEDLMKVEVTTSSKKAESFFDVPAAMYVITQDDIQASNARNIPDLLRMVPGMSVQQTGPNQWMVASRGFIDTFTNKLLVMIDGRSIYTPAFGGVDWAMQGLILEDIERIEVIRGPGGSLWGANAVNGIINIITKDAKKTKGVYAETGAGSLQKTLDSLRYGTAIGKDGALRIYSQYQEWGETHVIYHGPGQNDSGSDRRAGFRYDGNIGSYKATFQGDVSGQHLSQTLIDATSNAPDYFTRVYTPQNMGAWNLQGHIGRTLANGSEESVQAYYDHAKRFVIDTDETQDTFDIEAQRSQPVARGLNAVYGAGYRTIRDDTNSSPYIFGGTNYFYYSPANETLNYLSAFGQLEQRVGKSSKLIIGTKAERNDFTGWELSPSIRFSHTPDSGHTYWAAVTRTVRTPNRFDEESTDLYFYDPSVPGFDAYIGRRNFKTEKLLAFETGVRLHPSSRVLLDFTAFFNRYDDLRATQPGANIPNPLNPSQTLAPFYIVNGYHGNTAGLEAYGKMDVTPFWRINFGYSYLAPNLILDKGLQPDPSINITATPRHMASFVSDYGIGKNWNFDCGFYFQNAMSDNGVPTTTRVDLSLRYRPNPNVEGFITLQNATKDRIEGQTTDYTFGSEIPRSIYFGLKLRY